jgi:hypothetical protein
MMRFDAILQRRPLFENCETGREADLVQRESLLVLAVAVALYCLFQAACYV